MFRRKDSYWIADASVTAKPSGNISESCSNSGYVSGSIKCSINYKPLLGLFYTTLATVFLTLKSVFVKKLTYISPGQLSMIRNIGAWAGCLPIAVYRVNEVFGPKKDRLVLVLTGVLAATGLHLNLMSFRYLPLAEVAIIMSTMPAVISVMARVYLKEPCGLVQGFAIITTLGGVLLSVRLPEIWNESIKNSVLDSNHVFGIASAAGSVLSLSVSLIALRKMKDIHFSVSNMYIGLIGMVGNGVLNATTSHFVTPRCGWDQMSVLLIGILCFAGNCAITVAVQGEAVGIVSVMRVSTEIIVAIVFQIVFFDAGVDNYDISGACLVIVSVSVIGLKTWLVTVPGDSETRK